MSKKFSELTPDESKELIGKIAEVLKKNDLGDVPISTSVENVGVLMAGQMEKSTTLKIEKDLKADQKELAEKVAKEVKEAVGEVEGVQVKLNAIVGAGDQYATITDVVPFDKDEPCSLEHKEGEVWLVDFWATWCPPCQAPMAHNQKMLEKNEGEWGGKVKIIGFSIDQTKDKMVSHVKAKGWEKVEHYHKGKSTGDDTYQVSGVPHVMLIDTKGMIAFKGHPANRQNLEEDFANLLKGEKLTGEGCAVAQAAEGAEAGPKEGFSEMNAQTLSEDIKKASDAIEELTKDEKTVELAKAMPRCFCVIVAQSEFTPNTGKTYSKYENYRVLVGPQASIDEMQTILKEKVTGSFKVIDRVQAM